jgi:hypothetical protein
MNDIWRSLLRVFWKEARGLGMKITRAPRYWVFEAYFDISLMVAIKTLRANLGLWTPLLPSYSNSK